ncbi:hypothetical protein K435DRAFT_806838 [Dendrothele bispora CBS 962.96]|uniref:Uncharacterized protein n=1 Tax=Dendrothele bispora (strain CBS 962.96) TaxID=1314807 RepID=A0A4S8L6M3_DENBC|nr:hypothetical protein K435DRAFT_806838 [Dendrothele bispora CBS 962.96]
MTRRGGRAEGIEKKLRREGKEGKEAAFNRKETENPKVESKSIDERAEAEAEVDQDSKAEQEKERGNMEKPDPELLSPYKNALSISPRKYSCIGDFIPPLPPPTPPSTTGEYPKGEGNAGVSAPRFIEGSMASSSSEGNSSIEAKEIGRVGE